MKKTSPKIDSLRNNISITNLLYSAARFVSSSKLLLHLKTEPFSQINQFFTTKSHLAGSSIPSNSKSNVFKRLFPQERTWQVVVPLALFVISILIRVYKIDQFLFFGFEQGLDAERVRSIIRLEDFRLVGTKTDIDGIFQGGWWYYLMVIPYWLGGGNPVWAAVFVAIINSLAVLLVFWFAKDFFRSRWWGLVAGALAMVSFDFVTYSRWITINDPALPLVVLSFWLLWRYAKQPRVSWFGLFGLVAAFAAQFQIVLLFGYALVVIVLVTTKVITWPKLKSWLVAMIAAGLVFLPYILFNVRNSWITLTSTLEFLSGKNSEMVYKPSIITSLVGYSQMLLALVERTFSPGITIVAIAISLFLIVSSIVFLVWKAGERPRLIFLLSWVFMTTPYLLFTQSLGLHQLYIGTSAGVIMLLVLIAQLFSSTKKPVWFRQARYLPLLILMMSTILTSKNVLTNQGYYYISGVTGMNLPDELRVVDAIHRYGQGEKYRVEPFTVPYLSPNAWNYLRSWRYPEENSKDGDIIYVIIQPGVDPYWQGEWLKALKATELVFSVKFSEITLEKRLVVPDEAQAKE
ncbi:MAG: ArnT family glycosyltransferase [Patescibacteria group bacterium]